MSEHEDGHGHTEAGVIQLPAPTIYPMVLALGISLICTGMVTNIVVGLLGLLLTVWGAAGWFFEVLPHEAHVPVAVEFEEVEIGSTRTLEARLPTGEDHRKILPIETFQITTGLKGGIAGGVAMVVPATVFSLLRYHSVWYAMNLLAAGGFVSWAGASNEFLSQFHWQGLLAAMAIHGVTSLLVGLLYGAMLPMYPRYPIITCGFVAPFLFTALLHSAIGVVSPILNQRIVWSWFAVSQVAFGLVCGYVVNLHTRVRTAQFRALPFAVRAGIHSDRLTPSSPETAEKDRPQ